MLGTLPIAVTVSQCKEITASSSTLEPAAACNQLFEWTKAWRTTPRVSIQRPFRGHSEAITAPVRFMHIDCKVSNKPAERTTTLTLPTVGLT